jgi:hypothetical protein
MDDRPHDARTDRGISRSVNNTLITNPHRRHLRHFPCWCGESLVSRYRMMTDCCAEYLTDISWYLARIDLSVESPQEITIRAKQLEYFHTQRRADGHEIGGEYAFLTAVSESDWDGAEADAYDLDEQQEYWLDTWVLVRRQSRMLGPEPIPLCPNCDEPIEDHDDEERKVCHDALS